MMRRAVSLMARPLASRAVVAAAAPLVSVSIASRASSSSALTVASARSRSNGDRDYSRDSSSSSSGFRFKHMIAAGIVTGAAAASGKDDNKDGKKKRSSLSAADEAKLDEIAEFVLPSRSDPVSATDLRGPVKTVVGNSIDAVIMNPTADVVLDVYSPTCSQCASFAHIFQEVAEVMAIHAPSVTFAKMNGVNNYRRGFLVGEEAYTYPLIKTYPAGSAKGTIFAQAEAHVAKRAAAQEAAIAAEGKGKEAVAAAAAAVAAAGKEEEQPKVGVQWNMQWLASQSITEALVDHIYANATNKFDAEAVKAALRERDAALQAKLVAAHHASLPAGERIAQLAPCAAEWRGASDVLHLRTSGMKQDPEAMFHVFDAWKTCLVREAREVNRFWNSVKDHADFIIKVTEEEVENRIADAKAAEAEANAKKAAAPVKSK